ncbi:glycosyltransferase [Methylibium rhizosphaerae]|uniref:glycosyltransferase n=1 Tax=Methylibium rhizosphaerae TaxID=2570323 RepID=UPI00112C82E8|nr:glycosyltransferase [Methylibium rhizosphaerae]
MSRTLDLGCGDVPRNPFHADDLCGVDVRSDLSGNIRSADLVLGPIPFDDESFDYVTAFDFIEHVPRIVYAPHRRHPFVEVMNEVHRVLKPGGLFLSHTPAYPHGVAFRDPTHVNIITEETFPIYFDDESRAASIYGFNGAFKIRLQRWQGPHLLTVLQKTSAEAAAPRPGGVNPRVSVFIPVHNGERHLEKTLDSVLAQTFRDFELICIDDGSTDGSAQILKRYADKDSRVRIITCERNLGSAPKALNRALGAMTGGYFVYASQDDLFSADWLASMHARALETGADAVIPEVVLHHEGQPGKDRSLVGLAGDAGVELSGREACQHSLDWSIPGNALWNAQLVRRLGFEEFGLNSDEYSVRRFFLQCNKVVFSGGRFLYRQDNPDAVTKRMSPGRFDWPYTRLRLAQLLREHRFPDQLVGREIDMATREMTRLKQALPTYAAEWSPPEVARAQAAVVRFEQRLSLPQVFDEPVRRRTAAQRVAKWKNSLRKLPAKLGLR